ncbi:MAG: hypothetical protein ACRCYV_11705, partial [Aeromonas sp.]
LNTPAPTMEPITKEMSAPSPNFLSITQLILCSKRQRWRHLVTRAHGAPMKKAATILHDYADFNFCLWRRLPRYAKCHAAWQGYLLARRLCA